MGGSIMASTINSDTSNGLILTPDTTGEIQLQSAGVTKATINSSGFYGGTGSILQVVSVQADTGLVSFTSTSFAEVDSDLRVTITPKAANSTLIVTCNFLFGGNNESQMCQMKLYDITNSVNVNTAAAGSRQQCNTSVRDMSYDLNDAIQIQIQAQTTSGSTVARTYGMYAKLEAAATRYFFANPSDSGALGYAKPSITVMEVAA